MSFTGVTYVNVIEYKMFYLGSIDDCKTVCNKDTSCAVILSNVAESGNCAIFKNDALNYLYTGQKNFMGIPYNANICNTYIKQSY